MGGIVSGIMSAVAPRIEEAHQRDQQAKAADRQRLMDAANNSARLANSPPGTLHPTTGQPLTDTDREKFHDDADQFRQQYLAAVKGPKPLKPLLDKLGQVFDLAHKHGAPGAQAPGSPTPLAPSAMPGGGLGPEATDASGAPAPPQNAAPAPSVALPPPPGSASPPPPRPNLGFADAAAAANPAPQTPETVAVQGAKAQVAAHLATVRALNDEEAKIDADPSLDDEAKDIRKRRLAMSMGLLPKTQLKESTAVVKGADISEDDQKKFGIKPGTYYRRTWNPITNDTMGYSPASAPMGQIRAVQTPVTPDQARARAANGEKFLDQSGAEIDPADLKPYEKLTPVETNRGVHYLRGAQSARYVTVGNEVYQMPQLGQIGVPGAGNAAGIGPKQVPSSTTRQQVMIDPRTNAPTIQTLTGTRTPGTPGTNGAQGAGAPPPPPGSAPSLAPNPPKPVAMPAAMYNAMVKKATPVRAAAVQLVGDPNSPDFVPLESYAPLANDAGARERIGSAWRIIADELAKTEKTHGPIGTILSNATGITSLLADTQSGVVERALSKLKPEERDLLDREIAAYGSIIGLRTITGGSAAQFSAKSIERELPILGVNTASSRQFYNKLASLFEEIKSGAANINPDVLKEKPQYEAAAARLSRLAKGLPAGPVGPPPGAPGKILRARDPQGGLHEAPAGTPLPKGWKLEP